MVILVIYKTYLIQVSYYFLLSLGHPDAFPFTLSPISIFLRWIPHSLDFAFHSRTWKCWKLGPTNSRCPQWRLLLSSADHRRWRRELLDGECWGTGWGLGWAPCLPAGQGWGTQFPEWTQGAITWPELPPGTDLPAEEDGSYSELWDFRPQGCRVGDAEISTPHHMEQHQGPGLGSVGALPHVPTPFWELNGSAAGWGRLSVSNKLSKMNCNAKLCPSVLNLANKALPWWSSGWDFAFQGRGCRYNPWAGSCLMAKKAKI